jgi:hypothetical protein
MGDTRVAIDIQDLDSTNILDAFLGEKVEVFQTARGRKAILIGRAALLRLSKKLSLNLEEGHDGNQVIRA